MPQLLGRTDLEVYNKGAKQLRNTVVIPQGGVRRRFGLEYIKTLTADTEEYMLGSFIYSDDKEYLLVWTDLKLEIYLDDVLKKTIVTTYPGSILKALELKWSQSGNLLVVVHPDYPQMKLVRGGDDVTWTFSAISFKFYPCNDFLENYDAITFTLSNVKVGSGHTLTASSAIFTADFVGGIFIGIGSELSIEDGVARITEYTDTTHVKVDINAEFAGSFATGVIGKTVYLAEPIWTATKGYASTVAFYQGRLVFGGSKALPRILDLSVSNDYFNFNIGRGRASDAIQERLDKVNSIMHVIGDRTLQVFTSLSEHAILQLDGQGLKPTNASIRKQSGNGSENIEPLVLDNQTFYVKRGGKGVMSFVFDYNAGGYQSIPVSLMSSHLIRNPINGAIMKGSTTDDSNYLFLINNDGSLAAYQTLIEEKVSSWTLSDTKTNEGNEQSYFHRMTSVGDNIYFIIERKIDGVNVRYLEKLNWNAYTDAAFKRTYGTATDTITGLDHLNGEVVRVVADGYVLPSKTVESGSITIEFAATTVEIGLNFIPIIEMMPVAAKLKSGNADYNKKRTVSVVVDYYESVGIYVDNVVIPMRGFGGTFDYPVISPQTGYHEVTKVDGWKAQQTVTITQRDPVPMTVLAVLRRVDISES